MNSNYKIKETHNVSEASSFEDRKIKSGLKESVLSNNKTMNSGGSRGGAESAAAPPPPPFFRTILIFSAVFFFFFFLLATPEVGLVGGRYPYPIM